MFDEIKLRKEIAARLKQARKKAGYVLAEDFCKKYKLALNEYLLYEQGKVPIKASQMLIYCKQLQVSLHWLVVGIKP